MQIWKPIEKLMYMSKEKLIHHDILGKFWEVIGADKFTLNNINHLCIVDYHSKFLRVKKAEDMYTYSLILACNIFFSKFGLPKNKIRDVGGSFISGNFK